MSHSRDVKTLQQNQNGRKLFNIGRQEEEAGQYEYLCVVQ